MQHTSRVPRDPWRLVSIASVSEGGDDKQQSGRSSRAWKTEAAFSIMIDASRSQDDVFSKVARSARQSIRYYNVRV